MKINLYINDEYFDHDVESVNIDNIQKMEIDRVNGFDQTSLISVCVVYRSKDNKVLTGYYDATQWDMEILPDSLNEMNLYLSQAVASYV